MSMEKEDRQSEPELSIEQRFEALDGILERMDEKEVPLEEAFALYKSGLEQVQKANEMLDALEREMLIMNESGNLEEFS